MLSSSDFAEHELKVISFFFFFLILYYYGKFCFTVETIGLENLEFLKLFIYLFIIWIEALQVVSFPHCSSSLIDRCRRLRHHLRNCPSKKQDEQIEK